MSGGGSGQSAEGKKKARIEIIPLIDVIFFLLATFVLFTLSLNRIQSIDVNLPKATVTPPTNEEDTSVTLQISDAGNVYWNKELTAINDVPFRLERYAAEEPNPRVLIATDDLAKYGDTVRVLDMVRKAGIQQVSFETVYRGTGR